MKNFFLLLFVILRIANNNTKQITAKQTSSTINETMIMEIKILGTGCPKCRQLENLTREMIRETGIDAQVEKVEDIMQIMGYGVARTPGLVIDGKVVAAGKLPAREELKQLLTK